MHDFNNLCNPCSHKHLTSVIYVILTKNIIMCCVILRKTTQHLVRQRYSLYNYFSLLQTGILLQFCA